MKADWNCRLQISTFCLVSVFRIPFSLSDVIPNASFSNDLTNAQNFFIRPVCAFVVRKPLQTGFLVSRPKLLHEVIN